MHPGQPRRLQGPQRSLRPQRALRAPRTPTGLLRDYADTTEQAQAIHGLLRDSLLRDYTDTTEQAQAITDPMTGKQIVFPNIIVMCSCVSFMAASNWRSLRAGWKPLRHIS